VGLEAGHLRRPADRSARRNRQQHRRPLAQVRFRAMVAQLFQGRAFCFA